MKYSLYNRYYKLGLEHFINKNLFGLHKPSLATNVTYLVLMLVIVVAAQLF
ncbi:MAG: hypothetical protein RLN90_09485 [Balneolaceae bacterium]